MLKITLKTNCHIFLFFVNNKHHLTGLSRIFSKIRFSLCWQFAVHCKRLFVKKLILIRGITSSERYPCNKGLSEALSSSSLNNMFLIFSISEGWADAAVYILVRIIQVSIWIANRLFVLHPWAQHYLLSISTYQLFYSIQLFLMEYIIQ